MSMHAAAGPQIGFEGSQRIGKSVDVRVEQDLYRLLDDIAASMARLKKNFTDLLHLLEAGKTNDMQGAFLLYEKRMKKHHNFVRTELYARLSHSFAQEGVPQNLRYLENEAHRLNTKMDSFVEEYGHFKELDCRFFESALYEIDFQISAQYKKERREIQRYCQNLMTA